MAAFGATVALSLTRLLSLEHRPFLLPMLGILAAALQWGLLAAAVSSLCTLLLLNVFITPPVAWSRLLTGAHALDVAIFALTVVIVSLLAARRREAQLALAATIASIGDGVIVTDGDGRVRFLNRVAEQLTGWSVEEADGQHLPRVFVVVDEATRKPALSAIERVLRDDVAVGGTSRTSLIARDGREQPIADNAAPIRDANGRNLGAVLIFRDASGERAAELGLKQQAEEREKLLERERDARADAERANRLKEEFLATLSHELRTPLNAVLGWSHMLTRRQLTAEQQTQALAAIHRNAQAQARLVDDVLDLSRIVTGQLALTSEPVDVSEVVRTTAEAFMPALAGRRQELRMELQPGAAISGDQHRVRQIVWNLLSNASKFTADGGAISVRVTRADARVELAVSDTGQGIDAAFLPYIFDRFRQADGTSTRGHGGLGLGLALVRHLAEAHGGSVSATSKGAGQGATISVSLPAIQGFRPARLPILAVAEADPLGRLRLGEDAG